MSGFRTCIAHHKLYISRTFFFLLEGPSSEWGSLHIHNAFSQPSVLPSPILSEPAILSGKVDHYFFFLKLNRENSFLFQKTIVKKLWSSSPLSVSGGTVKVDLSERRQQTLYCHAPFSISWLISAAVVWDDNVIRCWWPWISPAPFESSWGLPGCLHTRTGYQATCSERIASAKEECK